MNSLTLFSIACLIYIAIRFALKPLFQTGTDYFYHLSLIRAIRENGYRFIHQHPQYPFEERLSYPQFFHWLMAVTRADRTALRQYVFSEWIQILVLFVPFSILYWNYQLDLEEGFLLAACFLLSPIHLSLWSSKNTGIASRGFGLMLGQCYALLLVPFFYENYPTPITLCLIILAGLCFLSSQFAFQFLILLALLSLMVIPSLFPLLILLGAMVLAILLFRRTSLSMLKGQAVHKMIYQKYLAEIFILKARPSIWWELLNLFKPSHILSNRKLYGFLTNPVVEVLMDYHALFLVMFLFYQQDTGSIQPFSLENKLILISVLGFLLTSFRFSRFLGEPQRYLEFVYPLILFLALQSAISLHATAVYWILGDFCLVSILKLLGSRRLAQRLNEKKSSITAILAKHLSSESAPPIVLTNNNYLVKELSSLPIRLWAPNLNQWKTGKHSFNEIFQGDYQIIRNEVIHESVESIPTLRFVVLDLSLNGAESLLSHMKEREDFRLLENSSNYAIFSK